MERLLSAKTETIQWALNYSVCVTSAQIASTYKRLLIQKCLSFKPFLHIHHRSVIVWLLLVTLLAVCITSFSIVYCKFTINNTSQTVREVLIRVYTYVYTSTDLTCCC